MFRGATTIHLDSKARLTIPSRYRDLLATASQGQLVCTIDLHSPCLLLYPLNEWEIIEQKLATLSAMNPVERRVQRLLLGHASECTLDSAGRILLASTLRQYAKLEKGVMLVGQLKKFELWDEQTWHQQIEKDIAIEQTELSPLTERLQDLAL